MPTIVAVNKLFQVEVPPPANAKLRADGAVPRCVEWRAKFIEDTGFTHYETVTYRVLETNVVENELRAQLDQDGNPVYDENGDQVLYPVPVEMPNPNPTAAALLAAGDVDGAVAADIARVKAAIEDPNNPAGGQ
jgi:hypothetical protein